MRLQDKFENKRLKDILLDIDNAEKTYETKDKIIQKYEPVYMKALSKNGRAHFYAPYKSLVNREFDTYWFNLMIIWIVTLVLYIILYYNLFHKTVAFFGNISVKKPEK